MNKDNTDNEQDKLFEALTIHRQLEEALTPPWGGYNGCRWHIGTNHWRYIRYPVDEYDIAYRNKDGQYHRLYGPAYISKVYDVECWYKDGVFHREGGPAVRHKNNILYYRDGVLHRTDGPAIVDLAGPKQYWIEGRKYSPKEFKKEISRRHRKGELT